MKNSIIFISLLFSTTIFAQSKDCRDLNGDYTCTIQFDDQSVDVELRFQTIQNDSVAFSLAGKEVEVIANGKVQESEDEAIGEYTASCKKDTNGNTTFTMIGESSLKQNIVITKDKKEKIVTIDIKGEAVEDGEIENIRLANCQL
jgi:hypothetical protein